MLAGEYFTEKQTDKNFWNLDETNFYIDYTKKGTVGAPGQENITAWMAPSASGDRVSPLIVFKGENIWDQWLAPEYLVS